MTPYKDNHITVAQRHYNISHAKAFIIERAFVLLKGRFRRLKYVDVNSIERLVKIIESGCYLHNICLCEADEICEMIDNADEPGHVNCEPGRIQHADQNGVLKRTMITRQLQQW